MCPFWTKSLMFYVNWRLWLKLNWICWVMSIKSHNYEENLVLSGRKNITESARNVISINLQSLLSNVIYYTKRRNSALVVCGVCVCVCVWWKAITRVISILLCPSYPIGNLSSSGSSACCRTHTSLQANTDESFISQTQSIFSPGKCIPARCVLVCVEKSRCVY